MLGFCGQKGNIGTWFFFNVMLQTLQGYQVIEVILIGQPQTRVRTLGEGTKYLKVF